MALAMYAILCDRTPTTLPARPSGIDGALILAILTATARMGRSAILMAVAVVFLTVLQPVLALVMRRFAPALAALHTVNALAIFLVTVRIAYQSRRVASE